MPITTDREVRPPSIAPFWQRLVWFVALWAGSVAALGGRRLCDQAGAEALTASFTQPQACSAACICGGGSAVTVTGSREG